MGPYCRYCDSRCFLPRVLKTGKSIIMATCPRGMANDLARTGQTSETAANPVLEPERVARIAAAPEPVDPSEFCGFCAHHADAHTYSAGPEDIPCVGCRGGLCLRPDGNLP